MLKGGKLIDCFSPGKDDLILNFKYNGMFLFMKITFIQNKPWFRFGEQAQPKGKNNLLQFKPVLEAEIEKIESVPFDRIFYIRFTNHFILLFKCHGTSSNIYLFNTNDDSFLQYFRKLKENETADAANLMKQKHSFQALNQKAENAKVLKELYPFFGAPEIEFLESLDFFAADLTEQIQLLEKLQQTIKANGYSILNQKLSLLNPEHRTNFNPLIFLTDSGDEYLRNWHKDQRKLSAVATFQKEISKKQTYLKQCLLKQNENTKRVSYKEMADLLMSNLSEIKNDATKFECISFDGAKKVSIVLDSKLSIIENAEKYYKKSKNEHKELQMLEEKINSTKKELEHLESQLRETENDETTFWKKKENKKQEQKETLPYYSFIVDGIELRVGKNAKSNDQLISKHAQKHHLWMHARSVAGSHAIAVIKQGQTLPNSTLEKMAGISAFYSKAKSQSLVPVIYTERKFIRKPKGALPGEVIVEREKVLLVKPVPPEK